jgi:2-C-methyl-D-erythritol 4-phosphate cytidylyltransferase/2-C-methyl-D-erythritol 2,4-cyclodiphosphate synthase
LSEESPAAGAPFDVVVVAAGSSSRMGGVDKLEAVIAGRPLVAWSLAAFAALPEVRRLVVVTAAERVDRLRTAAWLPERVAAVIPGGSRRQESVAAGVRWLSGAADGGTGASDDVVLVHDGARPAVSAELIRAVAATAAERGAAIPVVPVVETIKEVSDGVVGRTVDRAHLAAAQTPQGVRRSLLEAAYRRYPPETGPTWTDEAALLEACTITVHALPGDPTNLKVTLPADLDRAAAVLGSQAAASPVRVGFGSDSHPFGPGRPLALGGVEVTDAPRLAGHSDGDVALHAVAGALLGAAGLGDLGRLFPADASTPRGIASATLLGAVVGRVREAGYRPVSVDVTIVGSRPRLGARLDEMRAAIARLVGLDPTAVNVKASTGNLSGPEGAGRILSAQAIASVVSVGRSDHAL